MKAVLNYFSHFEICLWLSSVAIIAASFFAFGGGDVLSLIASLIGITALILCAKGNPLGQVLIIIFSILYGIISFGYKYYGEVATYLGMSAPMAVYALISWLRNPSAKGKHEVRVNTVSRREALFLVALTALVTTAFYFILSALGTANIVTSTISVTTSFAAVYLTARRSPFFALVYMLNDIVLIILWSIAAKDNIGYVSVIICFAIFLINDLYSFISWQKMKKRQAIS